MAGVRRGRKGERPASEVARRLNAVSSLPFYGLRRRLGETEMWGELSGHDHAPRLPSFVGRGIPG